METLRLALRNIRRNERRSKLTVITIVIGVTVLMNMQGLLRGITTTVYGHMMAMDTAQVQVEREGYRADARRLPLDRVIREPEALAARLRALPGVQAVSVRLDTALELTNGSQGVRTMARGIDQEETRVTDLGKSLVAGRVFGKGEAGLVVGSGLATKLGLKVGDSAWFTALDAHSVRNLGSAPIRGIFEYGYPLLDDYLVFLDLDQARTFLDSGPVATRLVVRGKDPTDSLALTRRVAAEIALARPAGAPGSGPGESLVTFEWKTFAENLVSTIETRLQLLGAILSILFVLIIAGIFNTMAMNVQERSREIGTLRAIGMRGRAIQGLFVAESLLLGLGGCIVAAIPSTAVGLWLGVWGLDLSGIFPRDIPIPFGTSLHAAYSIIDVLRALAAGLGAAVLGSILPARKASRLPITEALGMVR